MPSYLQTIAVVLLYAVCNAVFCFVSVISFIFGYAVFSLFYAIPIWITVVLVLFKNTEFLKRNSAFIGCLVGMVPALYFWSKGFNYGTKISDMAWLFPLIVIPPTAMSCGSALIATNAAFRKKAPSLS